MVVLKLFVAFQRGPQALARAEAGGGQHLAHPTIDALVRRVVDLRVMEIASINAQKIAFMIKRAVTRQLLCFGDEFALSLKRPVNGL